MKKLVLILTSLAVAMGILGCTPSYKPPDLSKYVWPPLPQKTRLRLLHLIHSEADVRRSTAAETLFGQQASISLLKPYGIAVDGQENIYVTDGYRKSVYIFNLKTGSVEELFHPRGWTMPSEVDIDNKNGLIAVTNDRTVEIFQLDSKKHIRTIGSEREKGDIGRTSGVAFDPDRKVLYVADTKKSAIYAYNYNGQRIASLGDGTKGETVYYPSGLAVDDDGKLYVVDTMNFRVVIFNPDGSLHRVFGEHGDQPGQLARPKGIGISREGLVFVTDASFNNFQIFDGEGNVYLFVGGHGKGPGLFQTPAGLYVDNNDKVYVVDQTNRRVQIFQLYSDLYYEEHPEEAAKFKDAPTKRKPIAAREEPSLDEEVTETFEDPDAYPDEDLMEEELPSADEMQELGW